MLLVVAATTLTSLLWPHNANIPFAFFYLAIFVAAILGHIRAGIVAMVLGALAVNYFFIPPLNAFALTPDGFLAMGLFAGVAAAFLGLIHRMRVGELRVRESEMRLRTVTDTAGVGLVIVDTEHRYLYANRAYAEILNLPVDSLVGRRVAEVLVRDGEGRIIDASKIARDITERKRAAEAVRETARFAQATIDALSSHLCVLDETGTILATNLAWRKFAQANPPASSEQIGTNYLAICEAATGIDIADADAFATGIRAVIGGQSETMEQEYPCHSPTTQRCFIRRVTRFIGPGPVRVVVAREDVTERKRAEHALRESEELFSAAFRFSPAAIAINRRADLIILEVNDAFLRMFGCRRVDIVGHSRAEMSLAGVDLSTLAVAISLDLQMTAPERRVAFAITSGIVVQADQSLVRIALENLLNNAWKFTGKTSEARIEFGVADQIFFIRDNGAGFDMAKADKLFGTFVRLHSANDFPGTGIGLTTVQRIVRRHGGRVWAEGKKDHGATVYFTLQPDLP